MSDPIEEWLAAAGFETAAIEPDDDRGDDPWAELGLEPAPLTAAQRGFVDASSPALGAALTHDLLGSAPLSDASEGDVAWADDTVIDFDDDPPESS